MRLTLALLLLCTSAAQAQWLDDANERASRLLWDLTGVPCPPGTRFYELPRVSQRLSTVNDIDVFGIYADSFDGSGRNLTVNVNRQYPWATPAGLAWSPPEQWRKVSAAYFPGKIRVYRKTVMVPNGIRRPDGSINQQPQPSIAWEFPDGTVFSELLIRRQGEKEWPFEIGVREKRGGKWDGVVYRPIADTSELPSGSLRATFTIPAGRLSEFRLGDSELAAWKLPAGSRSKSLFRATRLTVTAEDDESFVPKGYMGSVRSCNHCHAQAGGSGTYAGVNLRGSDQAISWQPFLTDTLGTDAAPVLDARWPLDNQAGLRTKASQ